MVIRQRAIQAHDKRERHDAILDAAEALLLRSPERAASVADVAQEARLAKGTVYLYFRSKEDLLLAVHERGVDRYFRAIDALLEGPGPVTQDDMLAVMRRHVVEPPLFLPMASRALRGDVDERSRRVRHCLPPAHGRSAGTRGCGIGTALRRARTGRGIRAAATELRADPGTVADLACAWRRHRARGDAFRRHRLAGGSAA